MNLKIIMLMFYMVCLNVFGQVPAINENELWQGNWIWYQNNKIQEQPACLVKIEEWIKKYPCSWGQPMVSHIIGECSNVGLKTICWVVAQNGCLYYPSARFTEDVYRNSNAGYDFTEIDIPRLALSAACADKEAFSLVVFYKDFEYCHAVLDELLVMYPGVNIVLISESKFNSSDFDNWQLPDYVQILKKYNEAEYIDITKHYVTSFEGVYKHVGQLIFKRELVLESKYKKCLISLTAQDEYCLWVNRQFVGFDSSWQRGEVYDITDFLNQGSNEIIIVANNKAVKGFAGLLANIMLDGEIIPCDDRWMVKPFAGVLDLPNLPLCSASKEGWNKPLIMSRGNVWPNYRLVKNNWNQIHPLAKKNNVGWWGAGAIIIANSNNTEKIIDGSLDDKSVYETTMPNLIEIKLAEEDFVSSIVVHSGYLEWSDNPSGTCSVREYKLWYKSENHSEWQKLSKGVISEEQYNGQSREDFKSEFKFEPLKIKAVAVELISSWDTGCRVRSPEIPIIPIDKRIVFIREIEVLSAGKDSL
ncbi:MAG: hypothetical protein ACIAQZ_00300 [Sedimentisphaeraceae bacterium JB056]